MSLTKSAANRVDWARVISGLKLTGKTATQLSGFKKRNDEARRRVLELEQQKKQTQVDFAHYKSVLQNNAVVDEIQGHVRSYKPVVADIAKQLESLKAFERVALDNAREAEQQVAQELVQLKDTLSKIEAARPFDELTVEDLVRVRPEIDAKVEQMVKKGKWDVPEYKDRFGDLSAM